MTLKRLQFLFFLCTGAKLTIDKTENLKYFRSLFEAQGYLDASETFNVLAPYIAQKTPLCQS